MKEGWEKEYLIGFLERGLASMGGKLSNGKEG
jgi:hypothetical protein